MDEYIDLMVRTNASDLKITFENCDKLDGDDLIIRVERYRKEKKGTKPKFCEVSGIQLEE